MSTTTSTNEPRQSTDATELRRFAGMAAEWWDPFGPMRPLHKMNPLRLAYLRDQICDHYKLSAHSLRSLDGLRLLDVGCGAGLLSEPLARIGANVTGIDPSSEAIDAAQLHAEASGVAVDYHCTTVEALARAGDRFDAVVALEVIEHVRNWQDFLSDLAMLVRPGGMLVLSTLNRTPKSFALAIVGAEYILGWLPRGTHDWRRFRKPSELAAILRRTGMTIRDVSGARFAPSHDRFELTTDPSVNYFLVATRSGS